MIGDAEYLIHSGGEKVWADGYRVDEGSALDAKHVGNAARSPFREDSGIPQDVRSIAEKRSGQFDRYAAVVNDPATPVRRLVIVTNDANAAPHFQRMLEKYGIPGTHRDQTLSNGRIHHLHQGQPRLAR